MILLLVTASCGDKEPLPGAGTQTVAGLRIVRDPVKVELAKGGRPDDSTRLPPKTVVRTTTGRALLTHDSGQRLLLADNTAVEVEENGFRLHSGKAWVEALPGARTASKAGHTTISSTGAGYELKHTKQAIEVYVVRGSVYFKTTKGKGKPGHAGDKGQVEAGYRALIKNGNARVEPQNLWDDWTGGMAWPEPAHSGPPPGVGEIGARRPGSSGKARFPLVIRRLEVKTVVRHDLVITRVVQEFFNPVSEKLEGIYRIRLPRGALLQSFGIDREGKMIYGYIKEREKAKAQYSAQVYQGSEDDPALLTWEAPGVYKAHIYPIPPGSTRRVAVVYTEWLKRKGKRRFWRYPLSGGGRRRTRIGELDIHVNLAEAKTKQVDASLEAKVQKGLVTLQRSDYVPRADLVLTLHDRRAAGKTVKSYRVRGADPKEGDFFMARLFPLPLPPSTKRKPLDMVIVADVSAGTDPTRLHLARTMTEALLRHLTPHDRIAVVGGDLTLHSIDGKAAKLKKATSQNIDHLLDALARSEVGGATDLGSILTAAAAMLNPERQGGVIYLGDAAPTVGEFDLKSLRKKLSRLPAPLRLYGVAVGTEADLDLLDGLAGDGGLALRIEDRAEAARAAFDILTHLNKPTLRGVTVDMGPGLERVYPRRPVSVVAGQPLVVIGRLRQKAPRKLSLTATRAGKKITQTYRLRTVKLDDGGDLRLRWASSRLSQLLNEGAGREEMVELGTRFDLITPYTSFYVPSAREIRNSADERKKVKRAGQKAQKIINGLKKADKRLAEKQKEADEGEAAPKEEAQKAEAPSSSMAANTEATTAAEPAAASKRTAKPMARTGARKRRVFDDPLGGLGGGNARRPRRKSKRQKIKRAPPKKRFRYSRPTQRTDQRKRSLGSSGRGFGGSSGSASIQRGLEAKDKATWKSAGKGGARGGLSANTPRVTAGATRVRGSLDKTVIRRVVRRHLNEVKYCYQSKGLTSNPKLSGDVKVMFVVGRQGQVRLARIGSSTLNHAPTQKCITRAVKRWRFPKPTGGGLAAVSYPFKLRPGLVSSPAGRTDRRVQIDINVKIDIKDHRPKRCSPASKKSLKARRILWRERLRSRGGLRGVLEVYQDAAHRCELPSWRDRRVLLGLMLDRLGSVGAMLGLYRHFRRSWGTARYLRRAIMGRVRTAQDLKRVLRALGMTSQVKWSLVEELLARIKEPKLRLAAIRKLLVDHPRDARLKTLLLDTLERLGRHEEAMLLVDDVEGNPYADADFRVTAAEFLLRRGKKHLLRAKRILSEMVEFRPRDPAVRRRLGDLYRAYGWHAEAYRQYQTLASLRPQDMSVLLLMAAAAAGSGRIDEALRLEARVAGTAEPGSAEGLAKWALLWSSVRLMKLRWKARQAGDKGKEKLAKLLARTRRSGVLGLAKPFRVVLIWSHPAADVELYVGAGDYTPSRAGLLGSLYGIEAYQTRKPDPAGYTVEVRRVGRATARQVKAELLIIWDEGKPTEKLWHRSLTFDRKTKKATFKVTGTNVEEVGS
jgi:Ca-activated chloride channel family protein